MFDRSQSTFSLLLNRTDGTFYDEIVFGIPNPETKILSGDINGDTFDWEPNTFKLIGKHAIEEVKV